MSGVRVLVGTRKGAFVLTADGTRDRWEVSGPYFGGWEIYHLTGSSLDPDRLYASQSSGWGTAPRNRDHAADLWDGAGNGNERTRPRADGRPRRGAAGAVSGTGCAGVRSTSSRS